ncbi:DUF421 domain-containing protein [Virgibacillus soli]|uniref:DUF421 domain-containing protein n=1 Tax=Paracerasibacillus soli TaxID=480284 RepID=A0ABU5CNI7_9BACI|nr:DUF421 domain-containing protein [Virgibacillus soli]MDY0407923.1 DUF421 domain-containing protein [Virgibacillus soli]
MKYLFMFIDTIFSFIALFILTRLLGKTQISQLTAFDFIAAVVLGELVGNALFDKNVGVTEIGFIIILWGGLLYLVELIAQKKKRSRYILEGKPALVIHKGNIIYEVLKKNKLDIDELNQLLRLKDVFSVKEVEYAVFETNGELSVLKKSPFQPTTKSDLNIKPSPVYLPTTLISDGEIIEDNLKEAKLTRKWLDGELKVQGFEDVEEVLYAEYTEGETLVVHPYTNKTEREID